MEHIKIKLTDNVEYVVQGRKDKCKKYLLATRYR